MIKEVVLCITDPGRDLPLCRSIVTDAAVEMGFADSDTYDIVAAVFEACANAVVHGQSSHGSTTLSVRTYQDRIEAVIKDSGNGLTCPISDHFPPPTSRRGRGIPIMKTFMDDVKFEFDNGCKVTLIKYLPTL